VPDEPEQPALTPAETPAAFRSGCGWFGIGFVASGVVGMGLAFWVSQNNGPVWLVPLAFFGPPFAFFIVVAAVAGPQFVRLAREAARNRPSPESAAAAAGGTGVEAGTAAKAPADEGENVFPTVTVVETTPGKMLAHRLPRAGLAPGCQFGCALCFAGFWNGIVGVFVYEVFDKWNRGQGFQWFQAAFLVPFLLVGLLLVLMVLAAGMKWFVSWLVGRVEVEVSAHPFVPGSAARVRVGQTGLFPLARVSVELACTEEATYVAGTSKSTAKREVASHDVSTPEANPDAGGLPVDAEFTVPADAMHSFDAPNNKINWTVRVTGRVLGTLPFSDEYAVAVAPGEV
jgi:hypothetical protein